MKVNTIKHTMYGKKEGKIKKCKTLLALLLRKGMRGKFLHSYQREIAEKQSIIPQKPLDSLVDLSQKIALENFYSRNGNVSAFELLCISSLVANRRPQKLLEIGTFDGNTTLQLALNSPENALVHTIDLPENDIWTDQPVLDSDLQFICDDQKKNRKFANNPLAHKIQEHFGDSTSYDFANFTKEGLLDFVFIDGGHSYQCVKSDTKNVLSMLSEKGSILWHDFTPLYGGVFTFLNELATELPLIHIAGTNLVYYDR